MKRIPQRVHIMGIGGAHMSAIAQILESRGHIVSGCDLRPSPVTDRLAEIGIGVQIGHSPDHISDAEMVVTTVAVPAKNQELQAASERGLPILIRAEMVARLMEGRCSICIAGSHGKSTTTSLIAYMLHKSGLDPTFLVGGEMNNLMTNAASGSGQHIVVEADEYAGAFLHYQPNIAVVTNIEADHLDYYETFDKLVDSFRQFLSQVASNGAIVACADDPIASALATAIRGPRVIPYALTTDADWRAEILAPSTESIQSFIATYRGEEIGVFQLTLPGRHNVANCLAAIATGHEVGLSVDVMREAIAEFRGVGRRFQFVGEAAGVIVMDDYAHHPTEVRATLATAKEQFPDRRLVCLFQPHTYSRTEYLLDGFRTCFAGVDVLFIAETYAAREEASAGLDGKVLADAISEPQARYVGGLEEAAKAVLESLQLGDVFFTIGAGDVDSVGPRVLEGLRRG